MGTHEPKVKNESRDMVQRAINKYVENKHKIIVTGDSHDRGCEAEIKLNVDEDFKVQGFITPGTGVSTVTNSAKIDIQLLSKQDVVVVWGGGGAQRIWEKVKPKKVLIVYRDLLRKQIIQIS
jgi:hypothetical protein